jgi:hypothetical protein
MTIHTRTRTTPRADGPDPGPGPMPVTGDETGHREDTDARAVPDAHCGGGGARVADHAPARPAGRHLCGGVLARAVTGLLAACARARTGRTAGGAP